MNVDKDEKLTLTEAAKRTPGRPSSATLARWADKGLNGVKLKVWRFGRHVVTTLAALDEFAHEVAAKRNDKV